MASKKHQRLLQGGTDRHHFYWPKKLYRNGINDPIPMSYRRHHEYHGHFMSKCKKWEQRICHFAFCEFAPMCCYFKTEVDYGRRVL